MEVRRHPGTALTPPGRITHSARNPGGREENEPEGHTGGRKGSRCVFRGCLPSVLREEGKLAAQSPDPGEHRIARLSPC